MEQVLGQHEAFAAHQSAELTYLAERQALECRPIVIVVGLAEHGKERTFVRDLMELLQLQVAVVCQLIAGRARYTINDVDVRITWLGISGEGARSEV